MGLADVSAPLTTSTQPIDAAATVMSTVVFASEPVAFFHQAFCAAVPCCAPTFVIAAHPAAAVLGMPTPLFAACMTSRSWARAVFGMVTVSVPAAAVVAVAPPVRTATGSMV